MAKLDLLNEAKSKGIEVTGDETVAELKALLKDSGESDGEVDAEEAIEHHDPKTFIGIEQSHGVIAYQDAPEGFNFDRSLNIGGRNVEHVHTDTDGVWIYRGM